MNHIDYACPVQRETQPVMHKHDRIVTTACAVALAMMLATIYFLG